MLFNKLLGINNENNDLFIIIISDAQIQVVLSYHNLV